MKRRYYTANIPEDAYKSVEEGFNLAIHDVKERMKKHYMVAQLYLVWIKGDKIRIRFDIPDNQVVIRRKVV